MGEISIRICVIYTLKCFKQILHHLKNASNIFPYLNNKKKHTKQNINASRLISELIQCWYVSQLELDFYMILPIIDANHFFSDVSDKQRKS